MNILLIIQKDILIGKILRTGFLLFMSAYISIGHLSQYLDCFEENRIELAQEKDVDAEEKEGKEEIEKDEFLSKQYFCAFLNQSRLHTPHKIYGSWNHHYEDIPTPPPKKAFA